MDKEKWEYRYKVLVSAVQDAIADLARLEEEYQNLPLLARRGVLDNFGELERRLKELPISQGDVRPFLEVEAGSSRDRAKGGRIKVVIRCFGRESGRAVCAFQASSPKTGMEFVLARIGLSPQGVQRFLNDLEAWKKTVQEFFQEVAEKLEAEFQSEVFQELEAKVALRGLEEA